MAYTSVLPVHRLDRSIEYVKDRAKTTKSAGSLEEAIDYALNREKTEQTIFEDAIGCTCENAYVDMVKTKERFHKKEGVQGYHLVQSFAEGEVSPELAHLIGQELAEQLLKGQYEVVITTHLNTKHYHNHLVWNSVSMVDGRKYHSNAKSYFTEVRQISDQLCRKYGLSVIQTNQGKAMHYAQWKAEAEGKPLEEQVLSLMKERRELYRKEPGGMRIQEINGELKELRKKIRLSQQIEKQSLEMEERLRQAKEQEEVQEMSGKQRREAEWNR